MKEKLPQNNWPTMLNDVYLRAFDIVLSNVLNSKSAQFNFKQQIKEFINAVKKTDTHSAIGIEPIRLIDATLRAATESLKWAQDPTDTLSDARFTGENIMGNAGIGQAAILYSIIRADGSYGGQIKKKLMQGKIKSEGASCLIQGSTDEEYVAYMYNKYKNFCTIVEILKPKKARQIITVAGYLLLS